MNPAMQMIPIPMMVGGMMNPMMAAPMMLMPGMEDDGVRDEIRHDADPSGVTAPSTPDTSATHQIPSDRPH
jgi:hypothetical protein